MNTKIQEIEYADLKELDKSSYLLLDIRAQDALKYGTIPGAVSVPHEEFLHDIEKVTETLKRDKRLVLYCTRGQISLEDAALLREKGFDAVSLKGGYRG